MGWAAFRPVSARSADGPSVAHPRVTERFPELDGIRGVAVSLVIAFHYLGGGERSIVADPTIRWFLDRGWSGVDLFFILSGVLIGGTLLDNKDREGFLRVFYWRRFLRIVPLYAALLGATAGLMAVTRDTSGLPWLAYVTFTQNIPYALSHDAHGWLAATWSLAVEEQFYLLAPLAIGLLRRQSLVRLAVGVYVAALALRVAAFVSLGGVGAGGPFSSFFTLCRFDDLMLGLMISLAMRDEAGRSWIRRSRGKLRATVLAVVCAVPAISWIDLRTGGIVGYTIGLNVYAAGYAALLLLAISFPAGWAGCAFRLPPLVWLGRRAYSLYLFHMPALSMGVLIVSAAGGGGYPFVERGVALALIIAWANLTWVVVEEPLIRWGHRASYGDPRPDAERAGSLVPVSAAA